LANTGAGLSLLVFDFWRSCRVEQVNLDGGVVWSEVVIRTGEFSGAGPACRCAFREMNRPLEISPRILPLKTDNLLVAMLVEILKRVV